MRKETVKKYGVRNEHSGKFWRVGRVVEYFADKEDAKAKRKELNGKMNDDTECLNTGWRVAGREMEK